MVPSQVNGLVHRGVRCYLTLPKSKTPIPVVQHPSQAGETNDYVWATAEMEPQQNYVVRWYTITDAISAWCELSVTSPAGRSTVLMAKTYMDKKNPETQKRISKDHMQKNVKLLKVGDPVKQSDSLGIVRLEIRRVEDDIEVEVIDGIDEVDMEYIDHPPQPPFITFEFHLKVSPRRTKDTKAEDPESEDSEKFSMSDKGLKSIQSGSGKRRRSSKSAEIERSPSKNRPNPSKCVQNSLYNDVEQQPEIEVIQRTNLPPPKRLRLEGSASPPDNEDIEAQLENLSKGVMKLKKSNDETEARIREEKLQLQKEEEKVREWELKVQSDEIERRRLALEQRIAVLKQREASVSTVSGEGKGVESAFTERFTG
ncbi:hypothetical protein K439DRAFT_1664233 [Ramaria rubella]|nr:hypothetical protein K439DRAFT_1664233 [Ramaria rubella]